MKKIILSLIAVAVGTLSSFAQSDLVATLSHGSSLSTFSGMDALAQAYAAAAEGDVITLSPGVFNAVNIEKAITVRGAGMQPMESNGYVVTQIIGAMTITVPDNASSVLSFEGVNPLTEVNIYGNNLAPINVMKCRFENNVEGYGISMNAVSCIFVTRLGANNIKSSNKYNTTLNCYNCVITNATAGGIRESYLAKIVAKNCIVLTNGGYVPYCSFTNCIISSFDLSAELPQTCSAYKCVGIDLWSTPDVFKNIIGPNVMVEGTGTTACASVFKTYIPAKVNSNVVPPAFTETFELTETAAATYLGDDGTQVGIYGGTNPFNPTPTNPQVKKFTVNSTTEGDQLKVKINVE